MSSQRKFLNTRNFLSVFYVRYVARQDRVTELAYDALRLVVNIYENRNPMSS